MLFIAAIMAETPGPGFVGGLFLYFIPFAVPAVAVTLIARRHRVGPWGTAGLVAVTCICVAVFAYVLAALALYYFDDDNPYACPDGDIYC